ncbi:histidine phosphatase family protein [Bdellovibrio sp. HCB2-146]|uniref:histidine phosphatase family protein n=1 Tax=Bdellovibrio sp. HCB2-146 TaxID=3394362 RepID=UPI0039BD632E
MKTLLILALLAVSTITHAMPSKIILVRHGEEPLGDEGRELSQVGWQRAEGLPRLFQNEGITRLIALKPHKKKGSIRSIQTLQPISQALGLEVQTPYTRTEVSSLVELLATSGEYDNQVVLIAWQHETLADIAHELGARNAPEEWGKAFDRYWVLEFKNGTVDSFKDLPQRILSGDSLK